MFRNAIVAIAATGLAFSSTAAVAREPAPVPAPKPAAEAKTRYCLKVPAITGTIIESRVCKTLPQWRAEGIDPTKPTN